jgi:hypothetical protein
VINPKKGIEGLSHIIYLSLEAPEGSTAISLQNARFSMSIFKKKVALAF